MKFRRESEDEDAKVGSAQSWAQPYAGEVSKNKPENLWGRFPVVGRSSRRLRASLPPHSAPVASWHPADTDGDKNKAVPIQNIRDKRNGKERTISDKINNQRVGGVRMRPTSSSRRHAEILSITHGAPQRTAPSSLS